MSNSKKCRVRERKTKVYKDQGLGQSEKVRQRIKGRQIDTRKDRERENGTDRGVIGGQKERMRVGNDINLTFMMDIPI